MYCINIDCNENPNSYNNFEKVRLYFVIKIKDTLHFSRLQVPTYQVTNSIEYYTKMS